MQSYDLFFELDAATVIANPAFLGSERRPRPALPPRGWIGSLGPGIDPATWPRGPLTGLPMFHALTLELPPDHQRRGPDFPAVAFFQGEGQFAEARGSDTPSDPFVAQLSASREHPELRRRVDLIGGQHALLWLTTAELAAGPTTPPPDPRRPEEYVPDDEGPNAWDETQPTRWVWPFDRPDPNAGLAPGTENYEDPFDTERHRWRAWAEPLVSRGHLGGTCFPLQSLPAGLTSHYLELPELPGLNFGGGGTAQIDLESDTFDWAC